MHIIYVGSFIYGATSGHRRDALIRLGYNVISIELYPKVHIALSSFNRISKFFFRKIFDFKKVNVSLLKAIESCPNCEVIWICKGLIIQPQTLIEIKKKYPQTIIIHYSPDDMFNLNNQTVDYLDCVPLYDYHITTKTYNVPELKDIRARKVIFVNNAFEPSVHKKIALTEKEAIYYSADISFIGSFEADRFEQMLYLANNGIKIKIWGASWRKQMNVHKNLEIIPVDYWGNEYVKIINATRINLCFLRKVNRDVQTTRSIEIPACGGFMLAERTNEHLTLFREAEEADFFDNKEELLSKILFYLSSSHLISQIADKGYKRCLTSGYSNDETIKKVLLNVINK